MKTHSQAFLCILVCFTTLLTSGGLSATEPSPSPAPFASSPLNASSESTTNPCIDNPYFRVLKNDSAPPDANSNIGARVIVALKNVEIQSSRGDQKLDRGQIAVLRTPSETFKISGEYFEVAFKSDHPPLLEPPQWIEPTKNKVIYEAPEFRVFEETLLPGDTREIHSHAQRVVIRLNRVQLIDPRFHDKGGKGGWQIPDTAKYAEPIVHAVKNLSEIPLFNIVIEYRLPQHLLQKVPTNQEIDSQPEKWRNMELRTNS